MQMPRPARRLRRAAVAALVAAVVVVAGSTAAHAVPVPTTWSDATTLDAQNPDGSIRSATTTTTGGTQLVVAVRYSQAGVSAFADDGVTPFGAPVWIANDPGGTIDEDHGAQYRPIVLANRAGGAVVLWNTEPIGSSTATRGVGASVYSGGVWAAPAYLAFPAPITEATFVVGADGTAWAVGSSSDGSVYLAGFGLGGTWSAFAPVPGATTRGGYGPPSASVTADGDLWLAYVGATSSLSVIGQVSGSWTTQVDLGTGDPDDYDPFDIGIGTLPSGLQQPIVAFEESSATPAGLKYAYRSDAGAWTTSVVSGAAWASKVVVAGAVDGTVALFAGWFTAEQLIFHAPAVAGTWSAPTDLAAAVPGSHEFNPAAAKNARGDIVVAIPTADGGAQKVYVGGIRAGTGTVVPMTLLSTANWDDLQGAADIAIDVTTVGGSTPMAWTSFGDDGSNWYGLYWIDAVDVFPPGPDPVPIPRPTPAPGPGPEPTFTG